MVNDLRFAVSTEGLGGLTSKDFDCAEDSYRFLSSLIDGGVTRFDVSATADRFGEEIGAWGFLHVHLADEFCGKYASLSLYPNGLDSRQTHTFELRDAKDILTVWRFFVGYLTVA